MLFIIHYARTSAISMSVLGKAIYYCIHGFLQDGLCSGVRHVWIVITSPLSTTGVHQAICVSRSLLVATMGWDVVAGCLVGGWVVAGAVATRAGHRIHDHTPG